MIIQSGGKNPQILVVTQSYFKTYVRVGLGKVRYRGGYVQGKVQGKA